MTTAAWASYPATSLAGWTQTTTGHLLYGGREGEREKQIREEDSNKRAHVQHGTKYHNEEDLLLLLLYSCSQAPQVGFCHKTYHGPMCAQHTTFPLTNTQTRMSVS